jgi:hypothetical protein
MHVPQIGVIRQMALTKSDSPKSGCRSIAACRFEDDPLECSTRFSAILRIRSLVRDANTGEANHVSATFLEKERQATQCPKIRRADDDHRK